MSVVFALLAAISYGAGDFVDGIGGRRTVAAFVPLAIQMVGVLFTVGAVLVGFGASPTIAVLAWGALSGIGSGVGNAALLRGLACGRMSVVEPLSAVVTAAVPAVVGLLTGDHLAWWGFIGIAVALPGVAASSWVQGAGGFRTRDALFGLLAGGGFGLLFVALDEAGAGSGAWPLLAGQIVALIVVSAVAAPEIARRIRRPGALGSLGGVARWGCAAGVLGATANLLFLLATSGGQLTVNAVLAGLYPAATVVLAGVFLGERPRTVNGLGLAGAGVAVVLLVTAS